MNGLKPHYRPEPLLEGWERCSYPMGRCEVGVKGDWDG